MHDRAYILPALCLFASLLVSSRTHADWGPPRPVLIHIPRFQGKRFEDFRAQARKRGREWIQPDKARDSVFVDKRRCPRHTR